MGKNRIILKHHTGIALVRDDVIDALLVEVEIAALNGVKAGDHSQQSRFTGAVLTDQADAVLGVDEQGYVVEKRPAAIADGEVV